MVVMMDREISCKGHCEKLSHFLDHVSHCNCQVNKKFSDIVKNIGPLPCRLNMMKLEKLEKLYTILLL